MIEVVAAAAAEVIEVQAIAVAEMTKSWQVVAVSEKAHLAPTSLMQRRASRETSRPEMREVAAVAAAEVTEVQAITVARMKRSRQVLAVTKFVTPQHVLRVHHRLLQAAVAAAHQVLHPH